MSESSFIFVVRDLDDTDRVGAALAQSLPDGTTISLCGTLGAGKTRLVQAIAAACDVARGAVVSPTFVLCQHYVGTRMLHHLDAYRLKDDDEFLELGVEELFASAAITIVEWGDRVIDCLPLDRVEIEIRITSNTGREFQIMGYGERFAPVIESLRQILI
jgi:tRNA threonylcarbamoyladenosine biosynthesis protein TsaE